MSHILKAKSEKDQEKQELKLRFYEGIGFGEKKYPPTPSININQQHWRIYESHYTCFT